MQQAIRTRDIPTRLSGLSDLGFAEKLPADDSIHNLLHIESYRHRKRERLLQLRVERVQQSLCNVIIGMPFAQWTRRTSDRVTSGS